MSPLIASDGEVGSLVPRGNILKQTCHRGLETTHRTDALDFFVNSRRRSFFPDNRVPGSAFRTIEIGSFRGSHRTNTLFQFDDPFISPTWAKKLTAHWRCDPLSVLLTKL
jgi:hypothetical protein